jgi:hypothetical protein
MPLTLRQHFAKAMEILSTDGVKSSTPPKGIVVSRAKRKSWQRNPKRPAGRPDAWDGQRAYATSVKMICEAYDRTSWMLRYLAASDEAASGVWASIPDRVICFTCRVQRLRILNGARQRCPKCKGKMLTYAGIVAADIKLAAAALRNGLIGVGEERG